MPPFGLSASLASAHFVTPLLFSVRIYAENCFLTELDVGDSRTSGQVSLGARPEELLVNNPPPFFYTL
jgi:hypothetical protein